MKEMLREATMTAMRKMDFTDITWDCDFVHGTINGKTYDIGSMYPDECLLYVSKGLCQDLVEEFKPTRKGVSEAVQLAVTLSEKN